MALGSFDDACLEHIIFDMQGCMQNTLCAVVHGAAPLLARDKHWIRHFDIVLLLEQAVQGNANLAL